jgi:hypothetical protein
MSTSSSTCSFMSSNHLKWRLCTHEEVRNFLCQGSNPTGVRLELVVVCGETVVTVQRVLKRRRSFEVWHADVADEDSEIPNSAKYPLQPFIESKSDLRDLQMSLGAFVAQRGRYCTKSCTTGSVL